MNKKFLSAILFGALMVTSTGTFVSCKDYDEDIDGLQTQVDTNKSAIEAVKGLQTQVTALQTALTTAQSTADAAKKAAADAATAAAAAKTAGDAAMAEAQAAKASAEAATAAAAQAKADAIAAAIKEANDLKAWVESQGYLTKDDLATINAQAAAVLELSAKIEAIETGLSTLKTDIKGMYDGIQEQINLLTSTSVSNIVALQEELALQQATLDNYEALMAELALADEEIMYQLDSTRNELNQTITQLKNLMEDTDAQLWNEIASVSKLLGETTTQLKNLMEDDKASFAALEGALEEVKNALGAAVGQLDNKIGDNASGIAGLEGALEEVKNALGAAVGQLDNKIGDNAETAKAAIEELWVEIQEGELAKSIGNLTNLVNDNNEAVKTAIEELWVEIQEGELAKSIGNLTNLIADLDGNLVTLHTLFGEMVTSVSLYYADGWANSTELDFTKITEMDNVFPADKAAADKQYTFSAGNSLTYPTTLLVRVSPTNAQLKPENISLINSNGEELTEFVYADKVEPYTELIWGTRAAANNGLWKVTLKLKENYNEAAFKTATKVYNANGTEKGYVRFALAVDNTSTEESAVARRVISAYDLTIAAVNGEVAKNHFTVNGKSIDFIHNRYELCEDGTSTENVQELSWLDDTKPGTTAILKTEGDIVKNADNRIADDRQKEDILPVVMGEPIKIQIDCDADGKVINTIKGFYVTLDKNFAMESVPSEINAWNSYTYENVGTDKVAATLIDGNEGTITIKNLANVAGDIIGFRVYAVNLDGTLLDPDGRAFYVYVGDNDTQSAIKGSVVATAPAVSTDFIAVPAGTFVAGTAATEGWVAASTNVKYADNANTLFDVLYFDEDKAATTDFSKVAYVKFSVSNVAQLVDKQTYTQTLKIYKSDVPTGVSPVLLKTVTAQLTKTMPTAFPEAFAFRPKQEEVEGTGLFRAYMIPASTNADPYAVTSSYATEGTKDLNNVFYGLDDNYKFVFKTSAYDAKNQPTENVNVTTTSTATPYAYNLNVETAFINNSTVHDVAASYLYKGVSTYLDATTNKYKYAQNYEVAYDKSLSVIYSCWHNASAFDWAKKTATKTYKPELQWMAEGNTVYAHYAHISSTNSYNNDYFGLDLNALLNTKGWLKIKAGSAKLTVNGQVNPYFKPEIDKQAIDEDGLPVVDDNGDPVMAISFTQVGTQIDAAPVADHEENLEFVVIDAYGHEKTISLAVTIKAPTKK